MRTPFSSSDSGQSLESISGSTISVTDGFYPKLRLEVGNAAMELVNEKVEMKAPLLVSNTGIEFADGTYQTSAAGGGNEIAGDLSVSGVVYANVVTPTNFISASDNTKSAYFSGSGITLNGGALSVKTAGGTEKIKINENELLFNQRSVTHDHGTGWGKVIESRGGYSTSQQWGYRGQISQQYSSRAYSSRFQFNFGYFTDDEPLQSNGQGGFYIDPQGLAGPSSDDRLKHDEVDLVQAESLEIILKLRPQKYKKSFILNDNELKYPWKWEVGFIAQEVQQIPELAFAVEDGDYVNEDGETVEETYRLQYDSLFTYAISAIQALEARVRQLEETK